MKEEKIKFEPLTDNTVIFPAENKFYIELNYKPTEDEWTEWVKIIKKTAGS